GLDPGKLKASAVKAGLVTEAEAATMDDHQAAALAFISDVTTSPMITDLSGRGLGLAIVREKVDKLGGTVNIDSRKGEGTIIRMSLPLSLSTFRGVVIQSGEAFYILPTPKVTRVVRTSVSDLRTVGNRNTIAFEDRRIPLLNINDLLGTQRRREIRPEDSVSVILKSAGVMVAVSIDGIMQEQEVV